VKASPAVWTGRVLTGLFTRFMPGASDFPKLAGLWLRDPALRAVFPFRRGSAEAIS